MGEQSSKNRQGSTTRRSEESTWLSKTTADFAAFDVITLATTHGREDATRWNSASPIARLERGGHGNVLILAASDYHGEPRCQQVVKFGATDGTPACHGLYVRSAGDIWLL